MSAEGIDPKSGLRISPDHEDEGWPAGVPYIIANEGCERFSFYGMKAILYVHLVSLIALVNSVATEAANNLAATDMTHTFIAGVYAFPIIGAVISDRLLGKYKTIFWLSLVYCSGHAVLSIGDFLVDDPASKLNAMYVGLGLIAVGSGGIKPCVSANVGDQFGKKNWFRVRVVFQAFYFIINFGSAFATILIPLFKEWWGAGVAFAIPGILMGIATFFFWKGRAKFVHVPAAPGGRLGALDVLASSLMFAPMLIFLLRASPKTVIIGFVFADPSFTGAVRDAAINDLLLAMGVGAACFAAGLAVFFFRQQQKQDDGFFAVFLWSIFKRNSEGASGGATSTAIPLHENEEIDLNELSDDEKALVNSPFWGPAVRKFGLRAAEGPPAVLRIITVFFLVSVFWALFDQHSSTWIQQAKELNRWVLFPFADGPTQLLASQIPSLNPWMVMVLIPIMNWIYKKVESMGIEATPIRRMTAGMFVTSLAFVIVALIQTGLDAGQTLHVYWHILPYLVITTAEVMVSITGLEFAYTQAPGRMKSTVMGFWLLTVSFGNWIVAFISHIPEMQPVDGFWLFAGLMALAGTGFGVRGMFYRQRDFTQA